MPSWKELKRFCEHDGWELYKITDHYFYRKQDADGNISFKFVAAYQGSTGMKSVVAREDDDKWYDLQGRQLNGRPSRKGIYINNGKKKVK